jgi:hypothetical protein
MYCDCLILLCNLHCGCFNLFCNVWVNVRVCGDVYMCGFCNVCVCVCVGFLMCGCVYVWI